MGGVNAALVARGARARRRCGSCVIGPTGGCRRLAAWWVLAVVLATAWWVVPLLLLGRYSPPFLDYIESAATTTSVTALTEVLRGTSDWVAYIPQAGWQSGWLLVSQPVVVLESVVVVGLGLVGLCLRRTPFRLWLVVMLLVGAVLVSAGHVANVDGFGADSVRHILNGPLAPLRNVHKFDVVLRLSLCLGVAAVVDGLSWGASRSERRASRLGVVVIALIAILGTATPLLALKLAPAGSYVSVPGYWKDAATYLADDDLTGRALVIPASRFANYYWGTPLDEPLQPLARSPWDVRDGIPLVPAGHIRMLDAVEQSLRSGRGSAGLATFLADSGISALVVRNDLDYSAAGSARPAVVHAALDGSPGLSLTRTFGPLVGGTDDGGTAIDSHLQVPYAAVEVWSVAGPAERRFATQTLATTPIVGGDPSSLLRLRDEGELTGSGVLAADVSQASGSQPVASRLGPVVVTDDLRRRETNYGGPPAVSSSATLTTADPFRLSNVTPDYALPGGAAVVATDEMLGVQGISASSSASDSNALGGPVRSEGPFAAFDGDPSTAWVANGAAPALGQWLGETFVQPTDVSGLRLILPVGSPIAQIHVTTDHGTRVTTIANSAGQTLNTPPGLTSAIRVAVTQLRPGVGAVVSVAELSVPGVSVARTLVLPPAAAAQQSPLVVDVAADPETPGCVPMGSGWRCVAGLRRDSEDQAGLDRTFTTATDQSYDIGAWASPRSGAALNELIERVSAPAVRAVASTQLVPDPMAAPFAAVDGDPGTAWIASPFDPDPRLTLSWSGTRDVDQLDFRLESGAAATKPEVVRVSSPAGDRVAILDANGTARFDRLRTDRVTLHLSAAALQGNYDSVAHAFTQLGIGVSEVTSPTWANVVSGSADHAQITLPCGSTPSIQVDGRSTRTRGTTTVDDLKALKPVQLQVCDPAALLDVAPGPHRLHLSSSATWLGQRLLLAARPRVGPFSAVIPVAPRPGPSARATAWTDVRRVLDVASRTEPTLLVVRENANAGWSARLGGHRLDTVTVDGWQQGYLLPAGGPGAVTITFAPDRPYRLALLLGGLAGVALLAGAALSRRRAGGTEVVPARASTSWSGRWLMPIAGLAALGALGGWIGLALGAVAPVVVAMMVRWPRLDSVARWLAGVVYLVCGCVLAIRPWGGARAYLGESSWLQIGCLIALAALVSSASAADRSYRAGLGG